LEKDNAILVNLVSQTMFKVDASGPSVGFRKIFQWFWFALAIEGITIENVGYQVHDTLA
jgi:hypothetical protein